MDVFSQTFGGSAVSPSDVAFAEYTFSSNLTLYWPQFSAGQTNVAARFMNLTATVNSLNVYMPDATLVSVGYDVIIFNAGSDTFSVVDFNGGAIATIAAGQTYYILLKDNTTQAGTWQTVQFGVGTGSASAAALAGAGLLAAAGLLNVNFDATIVTTSYNLTSAQRAILQVWNGGSGTITLPTAASVGDGFFFPLANNGSGSVTVATTGGDQIDGGSTSVFVQTQSGFVISSGTAWYTVGKGIQNTFSVTLLNLNVAGSSDITETSAQAQNIIQQYTGILTGNINVIVPNTVQLYYVFNNTSGAFTLTVKTSGGTGITVPQGTHSILYCDGTNIVPGFTATFGGGISLSPGSANAPNLNFVGSTSTGIYSPTANQFAITAGGFEVMNFTSAASSVNYLQATASATTVYPSISALGSDTNIGINYVAKGSGTLNFLSNGATQFYVGSVASAVNQITVQGATTTNFPILSATGSDTNVSLILQGKGTGSVNIAKVDITGGTIDNAIIGGLTPTVITGTTITANTGFVGNLTGNVTGNITGSAPAGSLTGTTLASNVVTSSLTSVGTLTNLTVTNPISGSISGNAATATKLATGRTIAITGDLAYTSPSFDGSANVTAAGTLATVNGNVGSFTNASITVNAKGLVTAASNGGGVPIQHLQAFTSTGSNTFTAPSTTLSTTNFKFTLTGAGGGGGNTNNNPGSGGAGAGATAIYSITGLVASTGYTITIGTGGTAGVVGGGNGGNGGNTTLVIGATTVTAGGGIGSTSANALGAAGGTATNGTINITGGSGTNGSSTTTGGNGGASYWGSGGAGAVQGVGAAFAGVAYGSGGGGGTQSGGGAGGAGANGFAVVEWVL